MRNFSQSFVKIALYGVVGSERTIKRVWDTSQQANLFGKLYGRVVWFRVCSVVLDKIIHVLLQQICVGRSRTCGEKCRENQRGLGILLYEKFTIRSAGKYGEFCLCVRTWAVLVILSFDTPRGCVSVFIKGDGTNKINI